MRIIRVAGAALNQTPLAWESNTSNIREAFEEARRQKIGLLCLPEMCISGYGCEDAFYAAWVHRRALEEAEQLATEVKGFVATVGLPVAVNGALYNTVAILAEGKIRGFVAKQHLAGYGVYYEPRWFKAWEPGDRTSIRVGAEDIPFGDLLFDVDGVRIGFEICEDAWVAGRAGIALSRQGVDVILNPSASHFAFGKHDVRERFVLEGSRAFHATYVYSNLLGCESGRIIYDGDCLVASGGEIIGQGERFSYRNTVITVADVDLDRDRLARLRLSSFEPDHGGDANRIRIGGVKLRAPEAPTKSSTSAVWQAATEIKEEEFTRAVGLGLFDYLRKSRSKGFVISLSGGVDSSAASCLVAFMIHEAVKQLGPKEFKQKLSIDCKGAKPEQLVRELLTCVYQQSANSSKVTENAAKRVAAALSAEFLHLRIDGWVRGYVEQIEKALDTKLTWKEHDTPLQNIQARVRSPSVWLIANLKGALLLTTSNRSEAAVGYTTMDGDTSGGLSPLGGIDKAFLRNWLRWMETTGPDGFRAIPDLSLVNRQAPTAELRPLEKKQTDEGDLMPYEVLDRIERFAIRDCASPEETLELAVREFAGKYQSAQLRIWVERFFRLWRINQWKRERYAPSFHLDDENLDPKTWCRYPILSGD